MRALGWPDAFPPSDVAVLKAMGARSAAARSPREADAALAGWQPWRAYAVLRLWNMRWTAPRRTLTLGRPST